MIMRTNHEGVQKVRANCQEGIIDHFRHVIWYTMLFAITAVAVYYAFWTKGKGFVWHEDGVEQHYIALLYLGQWGREVLKTVFIEHSLSIPVWDFAMGQGSDILTTLQYYGLGDPLTMLTIFVPVEKTELLYIGLVLVRVYLSGLFFLFFCRYFGTVKTASIAGAFSYAFCGFSIYAGVRHHFFLTPVMYFPLLILGSEKILRRESPALFIVSLFLTIISNFYAAFMECIMVILFVVVRYLTMPMDRRWQKLPFFLLRFIVPGLTGVAMATILLLPIVSCFAQNSRAGIEFAVPMTYDLSYYERYFVQFMGQGALPYWTCLGLGALSVPSLCLLFSKKKAYAELKWLFLILLGMQLIPFCGHIMNGFSYVSNRWSWAFAFLSSCILVAMWPTMIDPVVKEKRLLFCGGAIYLAMAVFLLRGKKTDTMYQWVLMTIGITVILCGGKGFGRKSWKAWGLTIICIVSVIVGANTVYGSSGKNYAGEFNKCGITYRQVTDTITTKAKDIMNEGEFGRYTRTRDLDNDSILNGTYGIATYWSLIGNQIAQYRSDMELADTHGHRWNDYDGRSYVTALNNVKYHLHDPQMDERILAFDFKTYVKDPEFVLYKTDTFLPMGYTYDSVLTRDEYEDLTAEQKQEALVQSVLLEQETQQEYLHNTYKTTSWEIPYEMEVLSGNCDIDENGIYVRDIGTKIQVHFDSQKDCELYLNIKGLRAHEMTLMEYLLQDKYGQEIYGQMDKGEKESYRQSQRYVSRSAKLKINVTDGVRDASILYRTNENQQYFGAHNYIVNLGYCENERNSIVVTFENRGVYEFDEMRIVCQPIDNLSAYISDRREEMLDNVEFGVNSVKGSIVVDDNKILCMAVPYSTGWKAYVDGEEKPVLRANVWSMAVELGPGEHTVEFRYMTPWLKTGIYISLLGWICFGIIIYRYRKKKWYVK